MKRAVVLTAVVVLVALWPRPIAAEDLTSQIIGIWKVKSIECVDSDGKECSTPLSKQTRHYVFSRGGRYINGSSSGAYTIEGGKITITYEDPINFPPTVLGRAVSINGTLMTLKSMPVVSKMARSTVEFTVVAEKVD